MDMDVTRWLSDFSQSGKSGRQTSDQERLVLLRELCESGRLPTYEHMLPLLFSLKGDPYTLRDHFPFGPLFRTRLPKKTVLKCGRQVSKSTSLAAAGLAFAAAVPHRTSLYITPLFEQIRRFSANYIRPFIEQSPVKALFTNPSTENSVLQRSLPNYAKLIFSFALLDANRVRGITSDVCNFDEVQDSDLEVVPIIEETMSYSPWELSRYAGTPRTKDGPVETLWSESSQAEWIIPCHHCTTDGHPTENVPAVDHHLDAMIGPWRDDISEAEPGTVCHKCRRPIQPRLGRWRHRHPDRRWDYAGYHVPQILMPLHYADNKKWALLLGKQDNYAPNLFHNEVLGESYDSGAKLVSETDLRAAAELPWENPTKFDLEAVDPAVLEQLPHYRRLVLGVDWGGGRRTAGKLEVSFTSMALVGLRADGKLDLLWGARLHTPHDHELEARQIRAALLKFQPHLLAHDYTGAGIFRETLLIQAGLPLDRLMAIESARLVGKNPIVYVPPSIQHSRAYWRMDKARTLLYTVGCLRRRILRTFAYDHKSRDSRGLLHDFLALIDEHSNPSSGGEIYMIRRQEGQSDDFAQATNLACIALWHGCDAWPNFAAEIGLAPIDPGTLPLGRSAQDFDDDLMGGFLNQP